ncbi:piggyBac transposable element-derived protein 4-like [Cataglyphis hispanica]|uniref:piggyBac transposable element-derived protein 4-like n=1 Tax=Cataglyphis hispanica TaxID=1086592 RepID=UPI00217F6414|nr:piggyBac transposable element-derived protein 4-like [Cataglyphis hispanica]
MNYMIATAERQTDPQGSDDNSAIIESSDEEIPDKDNIDQSSDSDCENIPNKRTRQCMRFPSSSEDKGGSNIPNQQTKIASDGTIWKRIEEGSVAGRLPVQSVFKDVHGPTAHAKRNIMKGNLSKLEASRVLGKNWTLTQAKLKAFLAILYARGAYEGNTLRLQYLWNKNQRSQRLQTDKFALVSAVWDKFIENSQNCFKPRACITVDEQLFPTKARCRFTQYMPNKPNKFGIKFWLASDVQTKYVVSGFPYLGKDEARNASTPLSEFVVMKLLEPYTMKGRTVTTDNFFTSIPLALKLRSKNTSLLGTIRANKRELPKTCKLKKDSMARFSTLLYQSNGCTLTVYKSKPNKKVLILSTKHKHVKIDKTAKKLPETVSFYNRTKFGVDVTDQMARKYTVKSGSRRWPFQVFFNILDLAGINCWILYKNTTGENISRKDFLFRLAKELASEY